MIRIETRGRMGNQMFQLAFAHVAARRLRTSYVLGPNQLHEGFELRRSGSPQDRAAHLFFRVRHPRSQTVEVANDRDPQSVLDQLVDGVTYGGFFQSERYLTGFEAEIRQLFTVRAEHEAAFAARYEGLGAYACAHVRRTDYLSGAGWPALPSAYFRDAIARVRAKHDLPVLVISDDIEFVRQELVDIVGLRFEPNTPMVDLLLLMNAQAVIASNSSFSWWGAWLSRRPDATVIAPNHWLGFRVGVESPRDVIPAGWLRVPVPVA